MNIHIILYSNNEPFNTTKRLTIETVRQFTRHNVIIHNYDLETIRVWNEKRSSVVKKNIIEYNISVFID